MKKKADIGMALLAAGLWALWSPQHCAASWLDVPLDEIVWLDPVVVVGKIVAITEADPPAGEGEYKHDTAYISVHEILKNELHEYPITVGDKLPLSMPARQNKHRMSTDIRYQVGEEGIWILEWKNGQFWATYPKDRQPMDEKQRIQGFIKNPLTDAEFIARRIERRIEKDTIRLDYTRVQDLSALAGVQIKRLDLHGTKITDFSPLAKSGITELNLFDAQITNLQTLAGLKLTHLNLGKSLASDLAPLSKVPLVRLLVHGSRVVDLSPLRGTSLRMLNIQNTGVSDLSPLAGLPLTHLSLEGSRVADLTPLRDLPIVSISFSTDSIVHGLEVLRGMKTLEIVNDLPAKEFWKKYDAGALQRQ